MSDSLFSADWFRVADLHPTLGGHVRVRRQTSRGGCMVTFYDVTELHRANATMRQALSELEATRAQIEKKNEELTRLAARDSLTGCLNRRAFFSAAELQLEKMKREARNLACIMVDIDFFKRINDNYGHQVGDMVIVAVARALSHHLRDADLLCRYGGEEFCIVLANISSDAAMALAERLRIAIAQMANDDFRAVAGLSVTSSFGISTLRSRARSITELVELADIALYASKRAGRNCATLWHDARSDAETAADAVRAATP